MALVINSVMYNRQHLSGKQLVLTTTYTYTQISETVVGPLLVRTLLSHAGMYHSGNLVKGRSCGRRMSGGRGYVVVWLIL